MTSNGNRGGKGSSSSSSSGDSSCAPQATNWRTVTECHVVTKVIASSTAGGLPLLRSDGAKDKDVAAANGKEVREAVEELGSILAVSMRATRDLALNLRRGGGGRGMAACREGKELCRALKRASQSASFVFSALCPREGEDGGGGATSKGTSFPRPDPMHTTDKAETPATGETEIGDSHQQIPLPPPPGKRPSEPETDRQHVRREAVDRGRGGLGGSIGCGAGASDTTSTITMPSVGRVQLDRNAGSAAASGEPCIYRPPRMVADAVAAAVAQAEVPAELDTASDELELPPELPCRSQVAGGKRAEVPVSFSGPDEAVNAGGEVAPPQEKEDEKNGERFAAPVGAADCRATTAVPGSAKRAAPGSKGRNSVQELFEGYPAAAASAIEVPRRGVADGRYMAARAAEAAGEARTRALEQQLAAEIRDKQMAEISAATFGRRAARAEKALTQAEEHWKRGSREAREENAALASIIDKLESVLLVQQECISRRRTFSASAKRSAARTSRPFRNGCSQPEAFGSRYRQRVAEYEATSLPTVGEVGFNPRVRASLGLPGGGWRRARWEGEEHRNRGEGIER